MKRNAINKLRNICFPSKWPLTMAQGNWLGTVSGCGHTHTHHGRGQDVIKGEGCVKFGAYSTFNTSFAD